MLDADDSLDIDDRLELDIVLELDEETELALDTELDESELDEDEQGPTNSLLLTVNVDEVSEINHTTRFTPYPIGGHTVTLRSVELS